MCQQVAEAFIVMDCFSVSVLTIHRYMCLLHLSLKLLPVIFPTFSCYREDRTNQPFVTSLAIHVPGLWATPIPGVRALGAGRQRCMCRDYGSFRRIPQLAEWRHRCVGNVRPSAAGLNTTLLLIRDLLIGNYCTRTAV